MIANAIRCAEQGLIERPYLFSFVLGQKGAMPATAKNLLHLAESIPPGSIGGCWATAGTISGQVRWQFRWEGTRELALRTTSFIVRASQPEATPS
jgi:uncharacterized protein (DUF849 family)